MRETDEQQISAAADVLWQYHCIFDTPVPSDVIIGLGSYDLRVADRCAALFHQGLATEILFTGHSGHWTRGQFEQTEASRFLSRAVECDVPAEAIILEERATNIGENIRFAAHLVRDDASAILVTKPQTQRRCLATAQKQWSGGRTIITAPLHDRTEQPIPGFDERHLICEMVGDLKRILTYPDAGFQSRQDIPDAVTDAYRFLIDCGYTAHL
ncbi:MAG: YdcF family protein [Alphaproteobacteria bacterium]|nr:YdcF family protein [Alphaproteobacteria bacterium]